MLIVYWLIIIQMFLEKIFLREETTNQKMKASIQINKVTYFKIEAPSATSKVHVACSEC